jgi:hypothetical protein
MDYKVFTSADYFIDIMVWSRRIFSSKDFNAYLKSQRLSFPFNDFDTQVEIMIDDLVNQNLIKQYIPVKNGDILYWCPEENTNFQEYNITDIIECLRLDLESELIEEDFISTTIKLICKIEDYIALMEGNLEKIYIKQ